MTFYTRLQNTAQKLLKGKGQSLTLTKVTAGTYNPATGGFTGEGTSTQAAYGAIFDYDIKQAGIYNATGTLIQMGDKQLLLSAYNTAGAALTEPVAGDTITESSGKTWTITQVKAVAPAGTVVMYECNLRV